MPYGFQIWHSASGSIKGPFTQHVVYEWAANGHGTEAGSRGVAEWDCHINDPCFVSFFVISLFGQVEAEPVFCTWSLNPSSILVSEPILYICLGTVPLCLSLNVSSYLLQMILGYGR